MILPSAITIVKATDLETQRQRSQDAPMIRQGAIIGKSDRMCATGTLRTGIDISYMPPEIPQSRHSYLHVDSRAKLRTNSTQ